MTAMEWRHRAACRALTPEEADPVFFPTAPRGRGGTDWSPAKAWCASCPVRADCLQYAFDTQQEFGMWGGMTPRQRADVARETGGQPSQAANRMALWLDGAPDHEIAEKTASTCMAIRKWRRRLELPPNADHHVKAVA